MARLKTSLAESSGGVVVRGDSSELEIVLVGRKEKTTWALPKGTPRVGETRDQTALRETREETGLEARILEPLDSITYWFMLARTRVRKTVYYFLMEAVGGDPSLHDPEYDFVQWFPIDAALAVMSYPNEVEMVRRARDRVARRLAVSRQLGPR